MRIKLIFAAVAISASSIYAQAPAQTVVQSVAPATTVPVPQTAPAAQNAASAAALPLLQQVKAANEETLTKQAATLLQLDEMQKAAEQIKIYTKRG